MSAIRRNSGFALGVAGVCALALLAGMLACETAAAIEPPVASEGGPTPVSTDAMTGFAIAGFDPVSYFTEGRPQAGQAAHELNWNGASWRFANAGNLDAFRRDPDIYAPRFGGFSVVSLARGQLADGNPEIFAMREGRVYLFQTREQAEVFAVSADTFVTKAEAVWRRINKIPEPEPAPEPVVKPVSKDRPDVDIFD